MNKKIAIYTCNFGNYRNEINRLDDILCDSNIDYYLFSDVENIVLKKWKIIYFYNVFSSNDIMDENTNYIWISNFLSN